MLSISLEAHLTSHKSPTHKNFDVFNQFFIHNKLKHETVNNVNNIFSISLMSFRCIYNKNLKSENDEDEEKYFTKFRRNQITVFKFTHKILTKNIIFCRLVD